VERAEGGYMERLVKFEVLGQEYPLYTDAPEEDIEEILQLVKMQIESNSKSSKSLLPASKVAVLTSLNMAGKYVRLKRDFEHYKQQMTELVERLTSVIQNSLPPEGENHAEFNGKEGVDNKTGLVRNE
jgi:cell division protein ZapA (FtsZ GTPase activity inhibitor)